MALRPACYQKSTSLCVKYGNNCKADKVGKADKSDSSDDCDELSVPTTTWIEASQQEWMHASCYW